MNNILYSVVFGIKAHYPEIYLDGWDKVILTDDPQKVTAHHCWTIKKVDKKNESNRKSNRYYKWLSHKYFNEYDYVMYFDSPTTVGKPLRNNLTNVINEYITCLQHNKKLGIFFKHPCRECVYDEMKVVQARRLDSVENVNYIKHMLETANFPAKFGLTENNVFIRYNKNFTFNLMFDEMYDLIHNHICRDQLVFMYELYKHYKINDILIYPHIDKLDLF